MTRFRSCHGLSTHIPPVETRPALNNLQPTGAQKGVEDICRPRLLSSSKLVCRSLKRNKNYLDPNSTNNDGPKPLRRAQQGGMLHTLVVCKKLLPPLSQRTWGSLPPCSRSPSRRQRRSCSTSAVASVFLGPTPSVGPKKPHKRKGLTFWLQGSKEGGLELMCCRILMFMCLFGPPTFWSAHRRPPSRVPQDLRKLGTWLSDALCWFPPFFGLGLEEGHVPSAVKAQASHAHWLSGRYYRHLKE